MSAESYALFDTPIGRCAVAWGARGVAGVQLPEASDAETARRVSRRIPRAVEAPPTPEISHLVAGIVDLLAGVKSPASELAFAELDWKGIGAFERQVYERTRTLRPGETATYGEIARQLGDPGAARAVGGALGRNPFPLVVPCHRVLAADGRLGGFSATGGSALKLRLLRLEGARGLPVAGLFDEP